MSHLFTYGSWFPDDIPHANRIADDLESRIDVAEFRKLLASMNERKIPMPVVKGILRNWSHNKVELFAMLGNNLCVESDILWIEDEEACKVRFTHDIVEKFPEHALSLSCFSPNEIAYNQISNHIITQALQDEPRTPRKVTTAVAAVCGCKELNDALKEFYSSDSVIHGKIGITIDPMFAKYITKDRYNRTPFLTSPYTLIGYVKNQFGDVVIALPIVLNKYSPRAVFSYDIVNIPVDYKKPMRAVLERCMADHFGIENRWVMRNGTTDVRTSIIHSERFSEVVARETFEHGAGRTAFEFDDVFCAKCPVCGTAIAASDVACDSCMNRL